MAEKSTTIKINLSTKKLLDKIKLHPRETYNDVLDRLLKGEWKT